MAIIDTFPYYNEKELLELRIHLLYDYVDRFIIIDADKTHKGEHKQFTCKNTLKDLGLLMEKIQVVEINLPSYDQEPDPWVRERMQRNAASEFINDTDIAIVSDCDEIIDPKCIHYYISSAIKYSYNIVRIPMVLLNCRADLTVYNPKNRYSFCFSPFVCLKKHLNNYTLSNIRESHSMDLHNIEYPDIFLVDNNEIEPAGWHFSWMGDNSQLEKKYNSSLDAHKYKLVPNYKPKEGSTDPLGRSSHILKIYPIEKLPSKIFDLPRVKKFLLDHE